MGIARIGLEAGGVYHIYNHAVGSDLVFREAENYKFFLRKISARIIPFAEVLAFCLMPNHFHFALMIKDKKVLVNYWAEKLEILKAKLEKKGSKETADYILLDTLIITAFANLFNSYVQAYNKKYRRMGTLLKESFQRKRVDSNLDLMRLICYIHNNPVAHGFTRRREDWKYSSYNTILTDNQTDISREEVLKLFGGIENFIFLHDNGIYESL
jgi:putative transposase